MLALLYALYKTESVVHLHEEKNGKEAPIWGVARKLIREKFSAPSYQTKYAS